MLDYKELPEKLKTFFEEHKTHLILKSFEDLEKFVWDYANECWKDGEKWGREHSAD